MAISVPTYMRRWNVSHANSRLSRIKVILSEKLDRARKQYQQDQSNPARKAKLEKAQRQFYEFLLDGTIPADLMEIEISGGGAADTG